ncbi:hypothetical protein niasHT_006029 [Heterodera trifolii]|uniref:Uncharacterized protein n=1 Tax=Heterodera trifolii TaxID=157864 RepID=A0ABD2M730_9BILA
MGGGVRAILNRTRPNQLARVGSNGSRNNTTKCNGVTICVASKAMGRRHYLKDSERHGPVSAAALAPNFWAAPTSCQHPTDAATPTAGRKNSSSIVLFGRRVSVLHVVALSKTMKGRASKKKFGFPLWYIGYSPTTVIQRINVSAVSFDNEHLSVEMSPEQANSKRRTAQFPRFNYPVRLPPASPRTLPFCPTS